ncbi:MAG: lytic transglycosylase domain-containing protein [Burkholderiaceae bacterium]|jgi:hypothetical protein
MNKQMMRNTLRDTILVSLPFMRNGLALVGLTAVFSLILVMARGPVHIPGESPLTPTLPGDESSGFLTGVMGIRSASAEPVADSAPAQPSGDNEGRREPDVLPAQATAAGQASVTRYLARKYHLSAEAIALMVHESYSTGRDVGLDPALLLAVIGVESGFNPFAESGVGAQGLMQVMSKVHSSKFEEFGGPHAALDPVANIKIGAFILKDCIRRGGSVRDGLRLYVGSTSEEGTSYGLRVLQERDRIELAARGGNPPITPVVAPAPKTLPTARGAEAQHNAEAATPRKLAAL